MKHDLKFIDEEVLAQNRKDGGTLIHEVLGVETKSWGKACDALVLELVHAMIVSNDERSVMQCVSDVISQLTPEEFGFDINSANGYMALGLIVSKAMTLKGAMKDGIHNLARENFDPADMLMAMAHKMGVSAEDDEDTFKGEQIKGGIN